MVTEPPRLATWLIERLGVSRSNESIVGDLVESYQHHQSAWRYWRQVILAIVASSVQQLRAHKLLALRALASGWLLYFTLPFLATAVLTLDWMRTAIAPFLVVVFLFFVGIGWVVARTHRRLGIASTMLFAFSILLVELLELRRTGGELLRMMRDGGLTSVAVVVCFHCLPVYVLMGGLLDASRETLTSSVFSSSESLGSFVSRWRDYAGHD